MICYILQKGNDEDGLEERGDKCGCHGGCAFFGKNSHGPNFFDLVNLFEVPAGVASMKVRLKYLFDYITHIYRIDIECEPKTGY